VIFDICLYFFHFSDLSNLTVIHGETSLESEKANEQHNSEQEHVEADTTSQTSAESVHDKTLRDVDSLEQKVVEMDVNSSPVDSIDHKDRETDTTDNDLNKMPVSEDKENKSEDIVEANQVSSALHEDRHDDADESNYMWPWLKYILDPILDEFKEGVSANKSLNVSESENTSIAEKTPNVTDIHVSVETSVGNITDEVQQAVNSTENASKKTKFQCKGRNVTESVNATVKLITTAKLLQLLNFDKNYTENVTDCLLVMFYAPWCHFCAKTAPHYNALARAFPQLDFVAVDTAQFSK